MPLTLGFIEGGVSALGGIFSNPNDERRKAEARALADAAIAGDENAFVKLRCLAGYEDARNEAIRLGFLTASEIDRGTPCGYATKNAQDFAKVMVQEVLTRRKVGGAAGSVAQGAYAVGTMAAPQAFFSSLGVGGFSPVLLVAIAVGAFLLLRKGR